MSNTFILKKNLILIILPSCLWYLVILILYLFLSLVCHFRNWKGIQPRKNKISNQQKINLFITRNCISVLVKRLQTLKIKCLIIFRLCSVFILQYTTKWGFCSINCIQTVRKALGKHLYLYCTFYYLSLVSAAGIVLYFPHLLHDIFCEISIVKASCICCKTPITDLILSPAAVVLCSETAITAIFWSFTAWSTSDMETLSRSYAI